MQNVCGTNIIWLYKSQDSVARNLILVIFGKILLTNKPTEKNVTPNFKKYIHWLFLIFDQVKCIVALKPYLHVLKTCLLFPGNDRSKILQNFFGKQSRDNTF